MATEKIKLLELDIDVDKVLKASKDLKDETVDLKKEMKKLKDQGKENSQEFVELEARYKSVRSEYNSSQRDLGKLINLQGKEIKTIQQGRNALSIISKEWAKQAQLYGENSVEAEKLAKKKTELTARLKDLEGATGDNRRQVGGYKDAIKEAAGELGFFGQVQNDVNNIFKSGAPLLDKLRGYFRGAGKDFKAAAINTNGYTGAQKAAFVATKATAGGLKVLKGALLASGIGAFVVVLGTVVAALGTMKAALSKTEEGQNKLNIITSKFSGFLNGVLKVLEPLANFIFNNVIVALETMGNVANESMDLVADGLAFLGFDQAAKNVKGFKEELQSSGAAAQDLAKASAELQKEQRKANKLQLDYQTRAEKLRQLRDDESKTLQERAQANKDLGQLLKKQANEELEIANKALEVSNLRIKAEGESTEALDERAEAELKIAEINERITSQESEQLTNLNQLRKDAHSDYLERQKEAIEAAKKVTDAAISESKTRLEIFIEENKGKADNLEAEVRLAEDVKNRKLSILKDELEAKKLTQAEYELANLQTKNEFLEAEAQLIAEYAEKKKEADAIAAQERLDLEALEKERKATDLENKLAIEEENFGARMELERERLEMLRQQELAEAEKTGADVTLINKKFSAAQEKIEQDLQYAKLEMRGQTLGKIKNLFSEESAIGKAFAIAEIANNTVMEATKAFQQAAVYFANPLTIPLGVQAAIQGGIIIATGAAQAAKVVSPKFEEGGLMKIGGKRHSSGGTKFYGEDGTSFEAEQGELIGVVNRNAASMINSLNKAYPMAGAMRSNNYLAAGGVVQRAMQGAGSAISIQQAIDYDLLAQKIGQANMMLPRPVVAVEEINTGQGNYAQVVNGANF